MTNEQNHETPPLPTSAEGEEPRTPVWWRKLRVIIPIAVALMVLIAIAVIGAVATSGQPSARGTKSISPSVAPPPTPSATFVTPGPQQPVALSADAQVPDEFDDWSVRQTSSAVKFLAADDAHDGAYALRVVSTAPKAAVTAQFEAPVAVAAGQSYTASAWVKSLHADRGAVELRPGSGWDPVIAVPGGSYDWRQISVRFTAESSMSTFRIVIRGPAEVLIDSLAVTPDGGPAPMFVNPGFELNSADLTVTTPSLLLDAKAPLLTVATRRAPDGWATWVAKDVDGKQIREGATLFHGLQAEIDLGGLPVGYYTLEISARVGAKVIDRSTSFGVIPPSSVPSLASSPFGIHLHYSTDPTRNQNIIDTLARLGFGHVRADVPWGQIEVERGKYVYPPNMTAAMQQYAAKGMTALQVPVYANKFYDAGKTPSTPAGLAGYGTFAANIFATFPNVGDEVEVYNEFDHFFNTGACGRTAACYIQMLDAVNAAVKPSYPSSMVVGPGNAGMGFKWPFLQDFFAQGGATKVDAISAHPYTQPKPATTLGVDIDRLKQMIRDGNGGKDKPIWITEMGWGTAPNWVTDAQQADYLVQTMATSLAHGVQRLYWYESVNQRPEGWSIEGNFGMFESDSSIAADANAPKPVAVAQAIVASELGSFTRVTADPVGSSISSYAFKHGDRATRVMWSMTDGSVAVKLKTTTPVTVMDIYGRAHRVKPSDGVVALELSGAPVYVTGGADLKVVAGG